MIAVTFQHPTPYFDDSYAVNSVNVGPYGDAIMNELIPGDRETLPRHPRALRAHPVGRIDRRLGSGGAADLPSRISSAAPVAYCPDSVTFSDVEGINIYEDENAFYKMDGWRKVPTANSRRVNGQLVMTSEQRNHFELANGTQGPVGRAARHLVGGVRADRQGRLLRAAVQQADRRDRQRGREVLEGALRPAVSTSRRTGRRVGPKLVDKLYFYTGDMDTYYLNNSTKELEQWMKTTDEPALRGVLHVRRQQAALLDADRCRRPSA